MTKEDLERIEREEQAAEQRRVERFTGKRTAEPQRSPTLMAELRRLIEAGEHAVETAAERVEAQERANEWWTAAEAWAEATEHEQAPEQVIAAALAVVCADGFASLDPRTAKPEDWAAVIDASPLADALMRRCLSVSFCFVPELYDMARANVLAALPGEVAFQREVSGLDD